MCDLMAAVGEHLAVIRLLENGYSGSLATQRKAKETLDTLRTAFEAAKKEEPRPGLAEAAKDVVDALCYLSEMLHGASRPGHAKDVERRTATLRSALEAHGGGR